MSDVLHAAASMHAEQPTTPEQRRAVHAAAARSTARWVTTNIATDRAAAFRELADMLGLDLPDAR